MATEQQTVAFKKQLSGYSNKLLSKLCVQWKNVLFCDMFIVTRNKHLPVHACVMSAFSSRVSDHISKSSGTFVGKDLSLPYIMMVEFSDEVIDAIVRALYTGIFSPPASMMPEVYAAVEWLDISELLDVLKNNNFGGGASVHASEDENVKAVGKTDTSDCAEDYERSLTEPDCIIAWDSAIMDLSMVSDAVSLESNNPSVEPIRKKARKPRKKPPGKSYSGEVKYDIYNNPVASFKNKQNVEPLDFTTDVGTETQGVSKKKKRLKKKKLMTQDKATEADPVMAEIDSLIDDIYTKKCEKCTMKFNNMETYLAHVTNHPVFTCQDCGEVFYRRFDHTRHQRLKHVGRPYLKCRHCEHQSKTEVECRSHYDQVHGEKRPFICTKEGCSFRSWRYVDLHLHLKIHSGIKEFCCEKCGQRFTQYISLKSHHKSCYQLGSFLCDLCGQSFNHQQAMKIHRRTVHLQEKPHTCKVCSKQFTHHSNLKRHMRIHTNSFPYSCPVCKQLFRHSNTLRGHMSSKHKDAEGFQGEIKSDPSSSRLEGIFMGSKHKEAESFQGEMKSDPSTRLGGMFMGSKHKEPESFANEMRSDPSRNFATDLSSRFAADHSSRFGADPSSRFGGMFMSPRHREAESFQNDMRSDLSSRLGGMFTGFYF